jgi:aspartate/methionine/tyrosine aminotransferase
MAALVRPGDEVLIERPAYDPMLGALRLLDASVRRFERRYEEGWAVDADRVCALISDRTRLVVITSPHNPSGVLATTDALVQIGRAAARVGAHVLVDEVYLDAVFESTKHPPAATLGDAFISINSLTKAFGLSGLRAGWVLGSRAVAEAVRRTRDVMEGIGAFPAERLAWYAFEHIDRLEARARALLEPNLHTLTQFIDARRELEWVRPAGGNVGFPRIAGLDDTRVFTERLQRERDTAVVPGLFFDSPGHIRIAFSCSAETLQSGLDRLGAALDALHA